MKNLAPLDLAWLLVESPQTPMHVGAIQLFSAPEGHSLNAFLEETLQCWQQEVHGREPFSLRAVSHGLLGMRWEAVERLKLDQHLQSWALPSPGSNGELLKLLAELFSEPLDLSMPPWENHVIEGLPDRRFALLSKVHHSMMDGIGGMNLLQSMLTDDPQSRDMPAPWSPSLSARSNATHLPPVGMAAVWHASRRQLRAMPQLAHIFAQLRDAGRHPGKHALTSPYKAPHSRINQQVSSHRNIQTLKIPLNSLQALAHRNSTKLNDVLLCLCAGGLRHYLQELKALPEQSLTAGIPVSIRSKGDTSTGTAVTFIVATLGTHIASPLQRLQYIHRATTEAKQALHGMSPMAITEYTLMLMAPYMLSLLTGTSERLHPVFNVVISNVPGPQHKLYYNQAKLEEMYPLSIVTHGQALNITALSYAGYLNIGFTACREALPSLNSLAAYIQDELQVMMSACALEASPAKTEQIAGSA